MKLNYSQSVKKPDEKSSPVFIDHIDEEKCTGCGVCVRVCPRRVLGMQESKGRDVAVVINAENCIGDGSCIKVCEPKAIVSRHDRS